MAGELSVAFALLDATNLAVSGQAANITATIYRDGDAVSTGNAAVTEFGITGRYRALGDAAFSDTYHVLVQHSTPATYKIGGQGGAGFTWKNNVASVILTNLDLAVSTIAGLVWDQLLASHLVSGSFGRAAQIGLGYRIATGTAQAGSTATTIVLALADAGATNAYRWRDITILGGTGAGQTRTIVGNDSGTKIATVHLPWVVNPGADSVYEVRERLLPGVWSEAGLACAGTASTLQLASTASIVAGRYVGAVVAIVGGTGEGQARLVTAYAHATQTVTVSQDWVTTPDATSVYLVSLTGRVSADSVSAGAAGTIADAVLDEALSGHTGAGTVGKRISDSATEGKQDTIILALTEISSALGSIGTGLATLAPEDGGRIEDTQAALAALQADVDGLISQMGLSGSRAVTLVVTDGAVPVPGVTITVRGLGWNTITSGTTDDPAGQAAFNLDDGTYLFYCDKAGYTFGSAYYARTVSADGALAPITDATAISMTAPANPALCNVYLFARDGSGAAVNILSATATAILTTPQAVGEGSDPEHTFIAGSVEEVSTIAPGEFMFSLVRGVIYSFTVTSPALPLTRIKLTVPTVFTGGTEGIAYLVVNAGSVAMTVLPPA